MILYKMNKNMKKFLLTAGLTKQDMLHSSAIRMLILLILQLRYAKNMTLKFLMNCIGFKVI